MAFVCLKAANVPPVCISSIVIEPETVFVVVGDVAHSMVSWRSIVVLEKNRISRAWPAERVWRVSRTFSELSSTTVIVFLLSILPCPQAFTKYSVLRRMLRQNKVCSH